jgi:TM2 domain-containing membrane protein YozV
VKFTSHIRKIIRINSHIGQIIILIGLMFSSTNFAQDSTDNSALLSASNRLKFGNFLFEEKDYLRAATELKEALRSIDNDTLRFNYAFSLFKVGRFSEGGDNFKILFINPVFSDKSRLMFYESNFFNNDYASFRELTEKKIYLTPRYKDEIERLKYISYFFDKVPFPEVNSFINAFDDSVQEHISHFYFQKKQMTSKSATTAAIFSTFIPGMGKIYTGEIGDGIVAFLSTAVSAYLTYSNFKDNHKFRGWLFSGLTAFFYAGNIYGSAASAQIYNARVQINFEKEVKLFFEQRNYFLPRMDF